MYTLTLKLRSFDLTCLKQTENSLFSILLFLGVSQIQQKMNPKKCKKITVLRSPHIDKKSREQYQIRSHKRTFTATIRRLHIVLLFVKMLKECEFIGTELEISMKYSTF
uniref:30S ribosomal protein S10 n=1 Tax=Micractinium sp. LBA 32 TaxID=1759591 RepID=A0A411IKQ7_9CHLO|nr:30S ribosomal protein S10 [Micractinium sp. LBA 32]